MKTYPLIRTRLSNEHWMKNLFLVLLLYLLPAWVKQPAKLLNFGVVLAIALAIDTVWNFMRYRRMVCSVSAAITAGVLQVLGMNAPLGALVPGIAAAIILGKQVWGGTGRNPVNPAAAGVLIIALFYPFDTQVFVLGPIMIAAMLLSLPFISFRPFAAVGLISGMVLSLLLTQNLSLQSVISYGVLFFSCVVITDPSTVTPRPVFGFTGAFTVGLASVAAAVYYPVSIFITLSAGIIAFNIASYILDRKKSIPNRLFPAGNAIKKFAPLTKDGDERFRDLSGAQTETVGKKEIVGLDGNDILEIIKKSGIAGMGGAGFPAFKKINTLLDSGAQEKYLIINGVECDPGLIHDYWLLRRFPEELYRGIEAVSKITHFDRVVLAVKSKDGLQVSGDLDVKVVPDYYPVGAEKILIKQVLGIDIPYNVVPAAKGVLVLNVQTVYSIYKAVYNGEAASTRFITALNLFRKESLVVKVREGMKIADIVESLYTEKGTTFIGGGIMQARPAGDEDVVEKDTNVIAIGTLPNYKESPLCSRCSVCIGNCPAGLEVFKIAELVDKGRMDEVSAYNPDKCIGCGTCSYLCRAGKDLGSRVKMAKDYCIEHKTNA